MKPTVTKEARYRLIVNESDAELLTALLGGIENPTIRVRRLYFALSSQLPDRTRSFSDFFAGTVRIK